MSVRSEALDALAEEHGALKVVPLAGSEDVVACGWSEGVPVTGWLLVRGDGQVHALTGEPAAGRGAPVPAPPPAVPGPPREVLAREALRQVVRHWPGDLRDVSVRVVEGPPWNRGGYRTDVHVALLGTPDGDPLGLFLRFGAVELRHGSPAVAQRIQREHLEWRRKSDERRAKLSAPDPPTGA